MKRFILVVLLGAMLFSLMPVTQAKTAKADAYFGYSRAGANLYSPYTSGMNGSSRGMLSRFHLSVSRETFHATAQMPVPARNMQR